MATLDEVQTQLGGDDMNANEFMSVLVASIVGKVGPPKPYGKEKTDEQKEAEKQLQGIKKLTEGLEELQKTLKEIQKLADKPKEPTSKGTFSNITAAMNKMFGSERKLSNIETEGFQAMKDMAHHATTGHSLHVHDYLAVVALNQIVKAINRLGERMTFVGSGRRRRRVDTDIDEAAMAAASGLPEASRLPEAGPPKTAANPTASITGVKNDVNEISVIMQRINDQTGRWAKKLNLSQKGAEALVEYAKKYYQNNVKGLSGLDYMLSNYSQMSKYEKDILRSSLSRLRDVQGLIDAGSQENKHIVERKKLLEYIVSTLSIAGQQKQDSGKLGEFQRTLHEMDNLVNAVKRVSDEFSLSHVGLGEFDASWTKAAKIRSQVISEIGQATFQLGNEVGSVINKSDQWQGRMLSTFEGLSQVAQNTGEAYENVIKIGTKGLRRGLGDSKTIYFMTKTGVSLSKAIGAETASTSEELFEWVQRFQMSNAQARVLSDSIQKVGRITGVTGDNLLSAVRGARDFANIMREAGNYSAESNEKLIQMSVIANKLGTEKTIQPFIEGLLSAKGFLDMEGRDKAFLVQAAQKGGANTGKLVQGTAFDTEADKQKMIAGIKQHAADIERMTAGPFQQTRISAMTRFRGLGELQNFVKTMVQGTETIEQTITRLEAELKDNPNIAESDKNQKIEEILQKKTAQKQQSQLMVLQKLSEKLGTNKDISSFTKEEREAAKEAMTAIADRNGIKDRSFIENAFKSGSAFNESLKQLSLTQETRKQEERRETDPVTKILMQINDSQVGYQKDIGDKWKAVLGWNGDKWLPYLAYLQGTAGLISTLLSNVGSIVTLLVAIKTYAIAKGFAGGASAAAEAAGAGGGLLAKARGGLNSGVGQTVGYAAAAAAVVWGAYQLKEMQDQDTQLANSLHEKGKIERQELSALKENRDKLIESAAALSDSELSKKLTESAIRLKNLNEAQQKAQAIANDNGYWYKRFFGNLREVEKEGLAALEDAKKRANYEKQLLDDAIALKDALRDRMGAEEKLTVLKEERKKTANEIPSTLPGQKIQKERLDDLNKEIESLEAAVDMVRTSELKAKLYKMVPEEKQGYIDKVLQRLGSNNLPDEKFVEMDIIEKKLDEEIEASRYNYIILKKLEKEWDAGKADKRKGSKDEATLSWWRALVERNNQVIAQLRDQAQTSQGFEELHKIQKEMRGMPGMPQNLDLLKIWRQANLESSYNSKNFENRSNLFELMRVQGKDASGDIELNKYFKKALLGGVKNVTDIDLEKKLQTTPVTELQKIFKKFRESQGGAIQKGEKQIDAEKLADEIQKNDAVFKEKMTKLAEEGTEKKKSIAVHDSHIEPILEGIANTIAMIPTNLFPIEGEVEVKGGSNEAMTAIADRNGIKDRSFIENAFKSGSAFNESLKQLSLTQETRKQEERRETDPVTKILMQINDSQVGYQKDIGDKWLPYLAYLQGTAGLISTLLSNVGSIVTLKEERKKTANEIPSTLPGVNIMKERLDYLDKEIASLEAAVGIVRTSELKEKLYKMVPEEKQGYIDKVLQRLGSKNLPDEKFVEMDIIEKKIAKEEALRDNNIILKKLQKEWDADKADKRKGSKDEIEPINQLRDQAETNQGFEELHQIQKEMRGMSGMPKNLDLLKIWRQANLESSYNSKNFENRSKLFELMKVEGKDAFGDIELNKYFKKALLGGVKNVTDIDLEKKLQTTPVTELQKIFKKFQESQGGVIQKGENQIGAEKVEVKGGSNEAMTAIADRNGIKDRSFIENAFKSGSAFNESLKQLSLTQETRKQEERRETDPVTKILMQINDSQVGYQKDIGDKWLPYLAYLQGTAGLISTLLSNVGSIVTLLVAIKTYAIAKGFAGGASAAAEAAGAGGGLLAKARGGLNSGVGQTVGYTAAAVAALEDAKKGANYEKQLLDDAIAKDALRDRMGAEEKLTVLKEERKKTANEIPSTLPGVNIMKERLAYLDKEIASLEAAIGIVRTSELKEKLYKMVPEEKQGYIGKGSKDEATLPWWKALVERNIEPINQLRDQAETNQGFEELHQIQKEMRGMSGMPKNLDLLKIWRQANLESSYNSKNFENRSKLFELMKVEGKDTSGDIELNKYFKKALLGGVQNVTDIDLEKKLQTTPVTELQKIFKKFQESQGGVIQKGENQIGAEKLADEIQKNDAVFKEKMTKLAEEGTEKKKSIAVHDSHIEPILEGIANTIAMIPTNLFPIEGEVEVKGGSNEAMMHQRIQTEFAGEDANNTMLKANQSLDDLNDYNCQQVEMMKQELEVLKAILATLTGTTVGAARGDTSARYKQTPPANYYDWSVRHLNQQNFGGIDNSARV